MWWAPVLLHSFLSSLQETRAHLQSVNAGSCCSCPYLRNTFSAIFLLGHV
uniref:Uncharacterized protein n=1 Tax=Sus scrofa TaxID=9823 RepID=A0ABB5UNL6_PIG